MIFKSYGSYLFFVIWFLIPVSFESGNPATADAAQIPSINSVPNLLKAEVTGIQDGDTIELKVLFTGEKAAHRMGKPLRIRFLHINCPERGRPFYKVAKNFTSQECFRRVVQIKHDGNFDKYGRLLGEVVLPDGKILNKELVKKGLAVHFKKYSSNIEYSNLEIQARKRKLGIWSVPGAYFGKL